MKLLQQTTIFISLVTAIMLSGCTLSVSNSNSAKVYTGVSINDGISKDIKHHVKYIYSAIQKKDPRYIAQIFPNGRLNIDTINNLLSRVNITDGQEKINLVGEFYIQNDVKHSLNHVSSSIGSYEYDYYFTPLSQESYVYLFYTPSANGNTDILVSLEFSKDKDKWFLTNIHFGTFLYNNMLAPKYVYLAFDDYLHNLTVPAILGMSITKQLTFPAGKKFHYKDESMIMRMYDEFAKECNERFNFPKTIRVIDTEPIVYKLSLSESDRLETCIFYQSSLVSKSSKLLLKENDKIHLLRSILFPGIIQFSDSVTYYAMSDTSSNAEIKTIRRSNKEYYISESELFE